MKKKKEQDININSDEILASVNKEPKGAKKKSNKKKEKKKGVAKKTTPIKQEKSNKKKKSKKPKKKVSKITKIKTEAQLKKEKRRKKLALFLLIVIAICLFLLSPIFNLKNVNIVGNSKVSSEEILSLSGLVHNESIFKVNKASVSNKIYKNPYIENIEIRRKIPSTINIQVVERETRFMLEFANAYVYINSQGYMLEITQEKAEVPLISGFTTELEEINPGNRLCTEDLKRLQIVIEIMEVAKNNNIANLVTKVDISDTSDYIVEFASEGKIAHLGDCATSKSNLNTKILYVKELIEEYEKGVEGEIFVNMDLNTKKVYFKEKV